MQCLLAKGISQREVVGLLGLSMKMASPFNKTNYSSLPSFVIGWARGLIDDG
jgi:hypothetical protein